MYDSQIDSQIDMVVQQNRSSYDYAVVAGSTFIAITAHI